MTTKNHLKIISASYKIDSASKAYNFSAGLVVGEIQLQDQIGNTIFYTNAEFDGVPNFIKTKDSVIDLLTSQSKDNEEKIAQLFKNTLNNKVEYKDIILDKSNPLHLVYCYLTYLVCSKKETANKFIKDTINKYLDEIEIPLP